MKNQTSTLSSRLTRWVWVLSLCTAFFWVLVAMVYLIRPALSGTSITLVKWVIALLMFGNAAMIIWLGYGLCKGRRLFYNLTLAYLVFNALLTVTDDFGMADLIYLVYVVVLFIALLLSRRRFLSKKADI